MLPSTHDYTAGENSTVGLDDCLQPGDSPSPISPSPNAIPVQMLSLCFFLRQSAQRQLLSLCQNRLPRFNTVNLVHRLKLRLGCQ